jgi:hypothetical protein
VPSLEELIEQFGVAPLVPLEDPDEAAWRILKGEWPRFSPPPIPRSGLTLDWLWVHVLGETPDGPDAEELRAAAEAEDRAAPETAAAQYRRAHPDWLEQKLAWNAEYYAGRTWQRLEQCFRDHGSDLRPERVDWLRAHEEIIRHVLEAAKAAHYRRYSIGTFWLTPDADGTVPAWRRERWPAPEDHHKVPLEMCTRWTRPEDRAQYPRKEIPGRAR